MNKENSLAFLDKCLNKIKNATPKDINNYKKAYSDNTFCLLASDNFEVCFPCLSLRGNHEKQKGDKF